MVVPKKPSNPGLSSRTNSTQATPRSSQSKSPAAAGPSASPKDNNTPSSMPHLSSSNKKSSGKGKKKAGKQKSSSGSSTNFVDRLVLLFLGLFVAYTVTVCPADIELENPVCHSLSLYRQHVLEPYVLPPIYHALEHPAISPFVEKAAAVQRTVKPYYIAADVRLRPYTRKAKRIVWDGIVVPTYKKRILPVYYQHVQPRLQLLRAKVDPYVSPVSNTITTSFSGAWTIAQQGYDAVLPQAQNAYATVQPYAVQAYSQAKPLALKAYQNVKVYSVQAYTVSEPYIRLAYTRLLQRVKFGLKTLGKWRRLYVDKHVFKIWDKVVELSGNEVQTTAPASYSDHINDETVSPIENPTPIVEAENVDVPLTSEEPVIFEEPTVTPTVVEELIPPSASTLSSTEAVDSSFKSQASEVLKSAPASVVSAFEGLTSSLAAGTEAIGSSVSSVIASERPASSTIDAPGPSIPAAPEALLDVVEEVTSEDDDGLDDLLAALGLDEGESPAIVDIPKASPVDEQTPAAESLSVEEKAARKKEKTARKRADLEKKHVEWFEKMDVFIEEQSIRVRELLGAVRTAAAAALFDRANIPTSVEVANFDTINGQDYDVMIYVDAERVSQLMDKLSAEGEQLVKGLESYLKREARPTRAIITLEERKAKWNSVLEKVDKKFTVATEEMRSKVRKWFVNVRDIEIRECLAISGSVKRLAERAQEDLGLGYVWLDDVTYYDWQKYHDLMRRYEKFDEHVRLVQNGTHPEPPPDPVVDGLDKLQQELEDLTSGFVQRVRALNFKALDEIFVEKSENVKEKRDDPEVSILPIGGGRKKVPVEGSAEAPGLEGSNAVIGKDGVVIEDALKDVPPENPVLSILPVEPDPSSVPEEGFDASQVVIGKDKVTVEEALKGVPVEEVHVEL